MPGPSVQLDVCDTPPNPLHQSVMTDVVEASLDVAFDRPLIRERVGLLPASFAPGSKSTLRCADAEPADSRSIDRPAQGSRTHFTPQMP
jgi:hypothetical protein